jgi:hypothetical protein
MIKRVVIKRRVIRKKVKPNQDKVEKFIKPIKVKEEKFLNPNSVYTKIFMIVILILGFFIGNFFVIKPTINSAQLIEADLQQKKSFLDTSETSKIGLLKKTKEAESELKMINESFFYTSKPDEFYTLFSEAALDHQLKIYSLNKVSEDFFKREKKDDPKKFDTFEKYKIVEYELVINGKFVDYLNFIKTLEKYGKSFVVTDSVIIEKDDGRVEIKNKIKLSLLNA